MIISGQIKPTVVKEVSREVIEDAEKSQEDPEPQIANALKTGYFRMGHIVNIDPRDSVWRPYGKDNQGIEAVVEKVRIELSQGEVFVWNGQARDTSLAKKYDWNDRQKKAAADHEQGHADVAVAFFTATSIKSLLLAHRSAVLTPVAGTSAPDFSNKWGERALAIRKLIRDEYRGLQKKYHAEHGRTLQP